MAGAEALAAALREVRKSYERYSEVRWLSTGIMALDLALGRGFPRARLIEISGDPSTAKTALGYAILGAVQRQGGAALILDSEGKADMGFARANGLDAGAAICRPARTIEATLLDIKGVVKAIRRRAKDAPIAALWDSIAATPAEDELEFLKLDAKGGSDGELRTTEMAIRARVISASLRALLWWLREQDVSLFCVNHLKVQLGRFYSSLDSPGGRALKYHASARVVLRQRGRIASEDDDVAVPRGIEVEAEVIANSCAPPFRRARLRFSFDRGFDPDSGLLGLMVDLGRARVEGPYVAVGQERVPRRDFARWAREHAEAIFG